MQPLSVGAKTFSGMTRCLQCDPADARELGMEPTGLAPRFELNASCRSIDEGWAIDYSEKRGRVTYHGGIDIPAPKGTPILAVADGELVRFEATGATDDNGRVRFGRVTLDTDVVLVTAAEEPRSLGNGGFRLGLPDVGALTNADATTLDELRRLLSNR